MNELLRFATEDGGEIVVQIDDEEPGFQRASRVTDGVATATETFEGALRSVSHAASSALRVFREGALHPDEIEIEFGIRLNAEAGAVIAKTSVEGHLSVKLHWSRNPAAPAGGAQ
ncbi:hypothetical protein Cme02nite_51390 [Catellatospora methionotrophica]|uniref:Trypsin-co-occurring domain-containing protein n=1 Tax=Catellatospora methionotrophica TaxID=121620 RepID=A0A8J3LCX7_9ACTN|nr:CU044_2847 family protein [Catellatospora methionotrophica]GIG16807.1 hypothetical protein Cme02nite_51390 [Catellatospora methionotrophica]